MEVGKVPKLNLLIFAVGVGYALWHLKATGGKFFPNGMKGMTKEERIALREREAATSRLVHAHQPRATGDRPDDAPGEPQVHVIYVVPADVPDRGVDTSGALATSIASWQNWLRRESGGATVRIDTYGNGRPDISFLRLSRKARDLAALGTQLYDTLEALVVRAGFDDGSKLYAVYYDGVGHDACGVGGEGKRIVANFLQTKAAGIPCIDYGLATSPDDPPGYLDYAMLHEIVHQTGAVAPAAPDAGPLNHVRGDTADLMYGGGDPAQRRTLDAKRRNYFNPKGLPGGLRNFAESPFLVWPAP
ncbi:MAG: hypothetical protein HY275_06255 [Gemmatimonadetes bacterium]|nr:hypothetical protein [Gemmatimonadota bacterium]